MSVFCGGSPPHPVSLPPLTLSVSEQQDLLSVLSVHVSFRCQISRSVEEPGVSPPPPPSPPPSLLFLFTGLELHAGALTEGRGANRGLVLVQGRGSCLVCLHGNQKSKVETRLTRPHQQAGQVHSSQCQDGEYSP